MNLEVQWFIAALVDEDFADINTCKSILQQAGMDADLATYAQTVLDLMVEQFDESELEDLVTRLQSLMEYATERAADGFPPEIFEGEEENAPPPSAIKRPDAPIKHVTKGDWSSIPPLDNISQMSEDQVRSLMLELLNKLRELGASDLHISAGAVPFVRKNLSIQPFSERVVSEYDAKRLNEVLLNKQQLAYFEEHQDISYALEVEHERFRVGLMMQKDGISGSYRLIPDKILPLDELGFLDHDVKTIERLLDFHNGLILVTGPLGSGKTSTLAAMVDVLNKKRHDNIIMVEDPIEIVLPSRNCNVSQRQIGKHTKSYNAALKAALREDPDIIIIGELHDLETIEMAITASETGHLVIGTLHTKDASNTLNRMLDVFPPAQQNQIRAMTAGSLRGIVCQQLFPKVGGGITVGYEILINTLAVSNLISSGKTHQLKAVLETGQAAGMKMLDQTLLDKFNAGMIPADVAESYITNSTLKEQLVKEFAVLEAKKLAANKSQTHK